MAYLQLRLLDPRQVELHGNRAGLATPKVLALLAYLTVTGQPHSRAALATLFWPYTGDFLDGFSLYCTNDDLFLVSETAPLTRNEILKRFVNNCRA